MTTFDLYGLCPVASSPRGFSPYVWKTKLDLAILSVTDYNEHLLSFNQIRGDLAKETSKEDILVPTIKTSSGEYVSDSWTVAEYLDKTYAKDNKTLFPGGEAAKGLMKMLEIWGNTEFAMEIRALVGPQVYQTLDEPNKKYWIKSRFGGEESKVEPFLANGSNPETIQTSCAKARGKLRLIENMLKYQKQRSGSAAVWLTGDGPSHADAMVFGWYAFCRMSPDLVKGVWEHEELPAVAAWVKSCKALINESELP